MKSKTADTDGTIIEFMQGSHSYDGIWFGEPHPILKGQFWWRTILREYLSSGKFHHPVPDEAPKEWEEQATKDYENGYESETSAIDKFVFADEAGEVYVWVKAMERLPDIDNKNPKHYLFLNEVNHHAIDIWTEFITNFPPLITSRLFDWKWLSPAPPSVEDAGKGWISVEDRLPENNVPVLVTLNNTDIDIAWKLDVQGYRWCKYHGGELFKGIYKVTHWQPLPPKP